MRLIYHLVPRVVWETVPPGDYRAASLATEGFIHLSNADQVAGSANRFYSQIKDLLLLHVSAAQLTSRLVDEPAATGELFPHVYGPIDRAAICAVETMSRGQDGAWIFPDNNLGHS